MPPAPALPCLCCGQPSVHTCARCKQARYCGRACQRRDWHVHKAICGRAAASPTALAAAGETEEGDCAATTAGETEEDDCAFCLSPAEDPLPLECRHRFCRACVAAYKRHSGVNDVCPLCRAPLPPGAGQLVDRAWRLVGLREKWQQQRNHGSATRVLQSMLRFGREAANLDPEHGSARFLLGWASYYTRY